MKPECEDFQTQLLALFDAAEIERAVAFHSCDDDECVAATSAAMELGPALGRWAAFSDDRLHTPALASGVLGKLAATPSAIRAASQRRPFEWATAVACGLACCLTVAFGIVRGDTERLAKTSAEFIGISSEGNADPQAVAFVERTEEWFEQRTSEQTDVGIDIAASLEKSTNWLAANFGPLTRSLQQVGENAEIGSSPPRS